MLPNGALYDAITSTDKELYIQVLKTAVAFYELSSKRKFKMVAECHPICRSIQKFIPQLTVVDGFFLGIIPDKTKGIHTDPTDDRHFFTFGQCDHSWLLTPDKNYH